VAVLLAVLCALCSSPAIAAEQCPVESLSADDIAAAISAEPTCMRAYAVMSACLFDTSGDVRFAKAVEDKCEPAFLGQMSPAQRRAYAAAGAHCRRKYAGQDGTMYVSFAATCEAKVSLDYARRYGAR
jgi:hypothetical protein